MLPINHAGLPDNSEYTRRMELLEELKQIMIFVYECAEQNPYNVSIKIDRSMDRYQMPSIHLEIDV